MYDFDESSVLTLDEMILAFRSTLSGLSKLSRVDPPTEADVETIVVQGYELSRKQDNDRRTDGKTDDTTGLSYLGIEKEAFMKFCLDTPEIMSWIEYFDDLEEYEKELTQLPRRVKPRDLGPYQRDDTQTAYMNPTTGGLRRLRWEKKGLAKHFMPKKNWENSLPFLTPARVVEPSRETPAQNVIMDWVYGYNAHSSRMSLYYTAKGSLIYPAGSVVVLHDIAHNSQSHFIAHNDVITCMKLYFNEDGETIVASGECGQIPVVLIWNCERKKILSALQGFHRGGIVQLDFSPDRVKLVTLGLDPYYCLAVYNWRSGERLWSARTSLDPVYDVHFLSDTLIASCGKDHIIFWSENTVGGYTRYRGLFGTAHKEETLWCVSHIGDIVVTGSDSGNLYVWEGRNLIRSIKAHTGVINAMYIINHKGGDPGLVTACSAGKIQVWNSKLEIGATFTANTLGPIEPSIISVCWDTITQKILLGFKTCEIFEMDSTDGRNAHTTAIVSGHFNVRVGHVAPHPTHPRLFCTVGADKSIRIFDTILHKQLKVSLFDTVAKSVTYSPDGQLLFVGLGSGVVGKEERKEGAYVVLKEEDLTIVHEARDTKGQISDIKVSPNGETVAMASLDGAIYVYNTGDYAAKAKCRGHTGKVIHLDYSVDGQFLRSNCTAGDLLFWEVDKGQQQAPKLMRDVLWETENCVYSFSTQSIWGPYADGVTSSAVCKSNSGDMLVTVDNCGRLRVYGTPCISEYPNFLLTRGHGANVQCVKFTIDDSYLLTTGGTDGTIIQWRVILPEKQDKSEMKKDETVDTDQYYTEFKYEGTLLDRSENAENMLNDRLLALCLLEEGEVDANDMTPWQRTIVAPSSVPVEDNSEPTDELELENIAGFSCDRCRDAMKYTHSGEVLFFSAAIAATMNQNTHEQKFYIEHISTISTMAVHPLEDIVATGEVGEVPSIRVWDSITKKTYSILEGFHRRTIAQLAFSPDGTLLASVGGDKYHTLAIYHWKDRQIVASTPTFAAKSFFLGFNPPGTGLIQCGDEVVRFWDLDGLNLRYQDGLFTSRSRLQAFLCAGWIGSHPVIGTASGTLYKFIGRNLDGMIQGHSGCVNAIASSNDGVCTAGADGFVKVWNRTLECALVIDIRNFNAVSSHIRCVDWDSDHGMILIGTLACEIYEVSSFDGESVHKQPLMQGHSGPELWGLAVHPIKDQYCTVGDDAVLRIWSVSHHYAVSSVQLEMAARSCAYSPDGKKIAIGLGSPVRLSNKQYDGKWIVLDSDDLQITHEARDSNKWITDMKYSPNGEMLAIGSYDKKLYVYSVTDAYSLSCVISQHNSFISHFDFSEDSTWIQSNCGGFELAFFESDTGMFIPAASRLRDVRWATQSCTLGWSVQGMWPPQRDGTEITSCDCNLFRGEDGTIIAAGDNYGRIQLYRFPAMSSRAISKKYRPGSSPVTRVKFVVGDTYLLTISGVDKSIMRWRHIRDRGENIAHNILIRAGKIEEDDEDVIKFFGLENNSNMLPNIKELKNMMTSRPWIASIVAPSNLAILDTFDQTIPPAIKLEVNHIFGLQCETTRSSVKYNSAGDILYPATKYICVYNKKSNSQIHFLDHENTISCLTVSKDGKIAASAEKSKRPQIIVWDAATCRSLATLPILHRRGISHLEFSSDRKLLLSSGQDQDHSIGLWESVSGEWTGDARLRAWNKGDANPVLFASFYHSENILFASGGRFHVKFWHVNGRCLNPNYADYSDSVKLGTALCGTAIGRDFISGSTSGHLHVWQGRALNRTVHAHEKGVSSIWSNGENVVTGSKDGQIKIWTHRLEYIRSFVLSDADVPPLNGTIRSIDCSVSKQSTQAGVTRVLIATAGGDIYELAAHSGSICLMHESHSSGELWGIGVHPFDPDLFATAGDDYTIRIWSISHKRALRKAVLDCTARCVNWSPDGKLLIIGMGGSWDGTRQRKDGAFLILDAFTLKPLFEGRDSRHWIQDVKFNPDGTTFAVGSMDHKIYIYHRETFRLKGTCDRHNSFIKEFDFSEDGVYIQSDSGDYEHLYFEAEDGEYFSSGSHLKDIKWSNWTCLFGWPVQGSRSSNFVLTSVSLLKGAWPYVDDVANGTAVEPQCLHRSPNEELLCVGDEKGSLKVYHYPCVSKQVH
jgi:WD40 repeat protein